MCCGRGREGPLECSLTLHTVPAGWAGLRGLAHAAGATTAAGLPAHTPAALPPAAATATALLAPTRQRLPLVPARQAALAIAGIGVAASQPLIGATIGLAAAAPSDQQPARPAACARHVVLP